MFYVYVHRRASDKKVFYVGKGKGRRAYRVNNRSVYWSRVSQKHGLIIEIIANDLSEDEAFEFECFLISEIGIENLSNLTLGGEGLSGLSLSEQHKRKISESHKGKKVSAETIEKIRKKLIGRKLSDEHRKKLSLARKGVKKTPEHIAKVAESRRGKSHTEQGKNNIRLAKCKKIICRETGIEFNGGHHAVEWLRQNGWPKASQAAVNRACNGKVRTAYGYVWSFKDENTRTNT